jgi:hypothetical protein
MKMNKKEYGFLVKMLFFLGELGLSILFELTGEWGRYAILTKDLSKLEKEYKKEIE